MYTCNSKCYMTSFNNNNVSMILQEMINNKITYILDTTK